MTFEDQLFAVKVKCTQWMGVGETLGKEVDAVLSAAMKKWAPQAGKGLAALTGYPVAKPVTAVVTSVVPPVAKPVPAVVPSSSPSPLRLQPVAPSIKTVAAASPSLHTPLLSSAEQVRVSAPLSLRPPVPHTPHRVLQPIPSTVTPSPSSLNWMQKWFDTHLLALSSRVGASSKTFAGGAAEPLLSSLSLRIAKLAPSVGGALGPGGAVGSSLLLGASKIGTMISGLFAAIFSTIGAAFAIVTVVTAVLSDALQLFADVMSTLLAPVLAPLSDLAVEFANALRPIMETLSPVITSLVNLQMAILRPVISIIATLFQVLSPIISLLANLLTVVLKPCVPIIKLLLIPSQLLAKALEAIVKPLEGFADAIDKLLAPLNDFLDGVSESIDKLDLGQLTGYSDSLQGITAGATEGKDAVGNLTTMFGGMLKMFSTQGIAGFSDFKDGLLGWYSSITEGSSLLADLKAGWDYLWEAMKPFVKFWAKINFPILNALDLSGNNTKPNQILQQGFEAVPSLPQQKRSNDELGALVGSRADVPDIVVLEPPSAVPVAPRVSQPELVNREVAAVQFRKEEQQRNAPAPKDLLQKESKDLQVLVDIRNALKIGLNNLPDAMFKYLSSDTGIDHFFETEPLQGLRYD